MKLSPQLGIGIVIAILVIVGALYFLAVPKSAISPTATSTAQTELNTVNYSCTTGTIIAAYSQNAVDLTLSDGRSLTLPQVLSGSGIRYESTSTATDIVFSSEGNNAFLTENGTTTYDNCLAGTTATSTASSTGAISTFTDQGKTFSFTYPSEFSVSGGGVGYSTGWMDFATTSGMVLAKLTIPSTFEPNTNFGDATFTIGTSADPAAVKSCTTFSAGGTKAAESQVIINGTTYTKFLESDAGAGNDYQTTSYRTVRNNQCYAVEYTIHSANIQNYDPSQGITAFDQNKVNSVLESIVQSVRFSS